MKNIRISPLSLSLSMALSLLTAGSSFALYDRGGDLGVGVRAMGLSGAFTALADDPSAAYWNPAGLAQLDKPQVLGMFGSYFNDKDRDLYLAFHYPLSNDIHLALSANWLLYTDIPGSMEGQYVGSAAIPLEFVTEKRLLLGASFRYFLTDTGGGNGLVRGMGVDLGLLFRQPFKDSSEFRAGLTLSDLSTSIHFDDSGVEQPVPAILTAGLAYKFDPNTLLTADVPWTLADDVLLNGENLRIRGGVEHWFFDGRFGLRAGYVSFLTLPGEFSLGASYRTSDWTIDYAFMNHADKLGNSHRLGAGYTFDTSGPGRPDPRPYMVQSLVGDEKIYLKWDIPQGSQADGYYVYIRSDEEKDLHRAKQEPLLTKYCLLRGATNGLRYHLVIRSIVDGREAFSCNEWVTTPQVMSVEAKKYYDQGMGFFDQQKMSAALYSARKAEELDPNNYDIKNLIRMLETTSHEGLVPEERPLRDQPASPLSASTPAGPGRGPLPASSPTPVMTEAAPWTAPPPSTPAPMTSLPTPLPALVPTLTPTVLPAQQVPSLPPTPVVQQQAPPLPPALPKP